MSHISVEIEIPDVVRGTPLEMRLRAVIARQTLERAVLELYRQREISTGTGAQMLGLSVQEFIEFLGINKISLFDFSTEEWQAELNNVSALGQQLDGSQA